MDLPLLRAFLKVAELGSVTRAAEALHQTQPAVSGQIAKLEHEIGRPLFERLARGVRLTEAGLLFREKVEPILRQLEEAKAALVVDPEAGRVAVAAIPTIAPYLLPGVLTAFAAEFPKARLEVMELTTAETLRHLALGLIDLAVLALPVSDETLTSEPLFEEELLLAVPTGHRLAKAKAVTLADLTDEPFVLLHDAHCLTGELLGFCTRHRLAPLVTARIHQLATLLELIRLGHGVSFVPTMAAGKKDGVAFRSLSGDESPRRTVGAVWAKARVQSRLAKAFVRQLLASGNPG